jgi:hypothetical protein
MLLRAGDRVVIAGIGVVHDAPWRWFGTVSLDPTLRTKSGQTRRLAAYFLLHDAASVSVLGQTELDKVGGLALKSIDVAQLS